MKKAATRILPTLSVCLLKVLSVWNGSTFGIFIIYIHMENIDHISIYHFYSKIFPELINRLLIQVRYSPGIYICFPQEHSWKDFSKLFDLVLPKMP